MILEMRDFSARRWVFVALVGLVAAACAIRLPPPRTPAREAPEAEKAWAAVLSRFVDEKGRVDFAGVAREPADLEAFVEYVSRVGPKTEPASFPTPESRLAYWINSYNALAMHNVVRSGIPDDLDKIRVRFFYRDSFRLDGSYISLYDLENRVIRPLGDPRVHAALNCMARGCPRLPREPFASAALDAQLEAATREFFNDDRHVLLEPEKQAVAFSQILEFYTKDFLKSSPTLIDFANRYRDAKIPAGWKAEFIPYDWRVNSQ